MKYFLPEISEDIGYFNAIGHRKRKATATDVAFVSESQVIAASYFLKELYLIDISVQPFKILTSISSDSFIDLIDYKNGMISVSHLPSSESTGAVSVFYLKENCFEFSKKIHLPRGTMPHGCSILNESTLIVSNMANGEIIFLDIDSERYLLKFDSLDFYAKDCCVYNNFLFVLTTRNKPSRAKVKKKNTTSESMIYLFEMFVDDSRKTQLKILHSLKFKGQTDSIFFEGKNGIVSMQNIDSILHFTINQKKKIELIKTVHGFSFPHGLSILNEKAAISNYGDNSIQIIDLNK